MTQPAPHVSTLVSLPLYCFPWAGGNADAFRSWRAALPAEVDVRPVQFPGHGADATGPLCYDLETLVFAVERAIDCRSTTSFALFGHSLGAIVAFEVARRVQRHLGIAPAVLYVSGRRAPHIAQAHHPWNDLPTAAFFSQLRRMNGSRSRFLDDPRVRARMEPILRADYRVAQTYRCLEGDPLECPIHAFGGTHDPACPAAELEGWRQHTAKEFRVSMIDGDHFFIESNRRELLALLAADLHQRLAALAGAEHGSERPQ